jgi:CspA family cold shock protein
MQEKIYYGKVCWFNAKQGIGFIEWEIDKVKQKDMFVHFSDINLDGFKTLYKDENVSFKIGENKHGQPKAIEVTVISK